ncbi:MAG: putative manganese-dependent inorganic diphosphatase [Clostridiales bacterium]|nr:putative manganese-dependent inorganic diphosphatase [Clostridiales bacterium]
MGLEETRKVWVVGHKNPDTDSVCSAIAYAYLKNQTSEGEEYEPKRAGELNEETKYVLKVFGAEVPALIQDVGAQVKDIEIRRTPGVSDQLSLKRAWEMMKDMNVPTLPITDGEGYLAGLITTQDITTSYMDIYDNYILSRAQTQYKNILDTLDGTLLYGNAEACFTEGKVMVGSANPEIMEEYIDDHDLVIMGNRYEAQICALEANADCIIVAGAPKISRTIVKMASERNCTLITTPYDTYTTARLINQSMPIRYFMRHNRLTTFELEEFVEGVRDIMSKERHRYFPILDESSKYVGMISRRNLLNMKKKQLILVDHNEKTQAADGIDGADILEIIDHHRIGSLETISPVFFRNQPVGCTATIIYQMFQEQGVEMPEKIAGLLCSAILSDTLMYRSPTCTPMDQIAAEALAQKAGIRTEDHARAMFQAGSDFGNKTPAEICYQDFKVFSQNDINFGVGQISAMTQEELDQVKEILLPYLDEVLKEKTISMVFVMLTNIIDETTYLICGGENADALMEQAYGTQKENDVYVLERVVSRKKQLIPVLMTALQEFNA